MVNMKEYQRQWYKDNSKRIKEHQKQWNKNNPGYAKQWRKNNSEHMKEYDKRYHKNNLEKRNEYSKQWFRDNPEYHKQYCLDNYEKIREKERKYKNHKRKTDLKYNLNNRMGKAIGISLKRSKNGRKWENLVGYTLTNLIKRLEITMPKGYNWQDYLEGKLHIDHIIPISAFNFTKPEHTDFKRCWALKNLRLFPAKANLIKHNKLDKPFQPALKI